MAFFERTVVGVVGDVRVRGLERASEPQVYVPDQQVPDGGVIFYAPKDLAVRTAVDPGVPRARHPPRGRAGGSAAADLGRADAWRRSCARRRAPARCRSACWARSPRPRSCWPPSASTACCRSSCAAGRRRSASASRSARVRRDILLLVLGGIARLTAAGLALGLLLAGLSARALSSLLAGVSPYDARDARPGRRRRRADGGLRGAAARAARTPRRSAPGDARRVAPPPPTS